MVVKYVNINIKNYNTTGVNAAKLGLIKTVAIELIYKLTYT